jgi:hypothetical protein
MNHTAVSSLFRYIETLQGDRPWGRFLDAGTGVKSLQWIDTLETDDWTAITAAPGMVREVRDVGNIKLRPQDRILLGNWADEGLLAGETFDTVLVDYLVGAIEGFSPYWQDRVFHRLRPHVAGRLYLIGLEPYVPFDAETEAGRVIVEIGRLRDACLLLAGDRPYREFPADWVIRHLQQSGFRLVDVRQFPIRYRERFVDGQLDMCLRRLQRFGSEDLAAAMHGEVERVRTRAREILQREDGLPHGSDYVIAAEPVGW